jgi:chromosome segregation ATPase
MPTPFSDVCMCPEKLEMMNSITDQITERSSITLQSLSKLENLLKASQKQVDLLRNESSVMKRKLSETESEGKTLSNTCKHLKMELASSQEELEALGFQEEKENNESVKKEEENSVPWLNEIGKIVNFCPVCNK